MLLPLTLGVMLLLLQWSLVSWAQSTAQAAAHEGAAIAARLGGSAAEGREAAAEVADNGAVSSVSVVVERGGTETVATVTGRAVTVLWPREVTATAHVPSERLTDA